MIRDCTGHSYPFLGAALAQAAANFEHYDSPSIRCQLPPGYALDFLKQDLSAILASLGEAALEERNAP
jgi:hypothetical protein